MTDARTEGPLQRLATAFPDEVVTVSRVRVFDLPLGAGRMALITMDNGLDHTRPSTFGPAGLASLDAAIDEILTLPDITAVGITGKPFVFAVGADLSAVDRISTLDQARDVVELGHAVFRRLGELDVPTFAFVNGAAMGGGLELALHCTYRTLSSSAAAISLPEVFLGLVPGWGGAWLLPNLIGPASALTVILANAMAQNKQLRPAKAGELGVVDVVLDPADFLEQSLLWAARVLRGDITVDRPVVDRTNWDAAIAAARAGLDARLHGCTPAPYAALELIAGAATRTRDDGFTAEDAALSTLMMGDDLRASLYAFNLVQKRAKRPVGAPDPSSARPVTKAGVIGAGLMATQLALLLVRRLEIPIVITDITEERVAAGLARIHGEIESLAQAGKLSPDRARRLISLVSGTTDHSAFADADFIIEAVFEELAIKKQVFADLEAVVRPDCILATNTSSLSVTAMAADLKHPERVVGFHFFNPVAVMPLLEIAQAEQTDAATLATAFAVGRQLKKTCVLVRDTPAFVVNRLLTRFLGEITRAVDEGTDFDTVDSALWPLGLPLSPFVLLQLVGPAVALHVAETMAGAYPDRFAVSENIARMVAANKSSIYLWDEAGRPSVDPAITALFTVGDKPSSADEVLRRVLDAMADEARRMLDEGVVAEPQDIDLCMITGAGWPFWLGGLTPYLDRSGAAERVTGRRFLPPGVASVPSRS